MSFFSGMQSWQSRLQPAWVILGVVCVCAASLPEITDENFINECVEEHNRARMSVQPPANDMLYMSWDAALAITARAWAKRCIYGRNIYLEDAQRAHPNFSSVGENIMTGFPPSTFSVGMAVRDWAEEGYFYNYTTNNCSGYCESYTQVVWANTYKVGCAVQLCPNGVKNTKAHREMYLFICNYAPGGNVVGRWPYKSGGAACSGCRESCRDNLCRSKERESQISYNWSPDWEPYDSFAANSNYGMVLIARPITLLVTFLAAYAVHRYNPTIFGYEWTSLGG